MRKPLLKALIIFSLILTVFTACDHNVYMGDITKDVWEVKGKTFYKFSDALSYYLSTLGSKAITENDVIKLIRDVPASERGEGIVIPDSFPAEGNLRVDFNGHEYWFFDNLEYFFEIRHGDTIEIINGTTVIDVPANPVPKALVVNTKTVTIDDHLIDDRRPVPKAVDVQENGILRVISSSSSTQNALKGEVSVAGGGQLNVDGGFIEATSFDVASDESDIEGKVYLSSGYIFVSDTLSINTNGKVYVSGGIISTDTIRAASTDGEQKAEFHLTGGDLNTANLNAGNNSIINISQPDAGNPSQAFIKNTAIDSSASFTVSDGDVTFRTSIDKDAAGTFKISGGIIHNPHVLTPYVEQAIIDGEGTETTTNIVIHEPLEAHAKKEPTCTEDGNIEYWQCLRCLKYFADEACTDEKTEEQLIIHALGHDMSPVEEVEPDCETTGIVEHYHCSRCGLNFTDQEGSTEIDDIVIPALGHDIDGVSWTNTDPEGHYKICKRHSEHHAEFGAHVYDSDPVYNPDSGLMERTCTVCGYVDKHDHIHQLIHHPEEPKTCTTNGIIEYWSCDICGKLYRDSSADSEITDPDELIIPASHEPEHVDAQAPTCVLPGNIEHWHCTACGKNFEEEACTHEIADVVIPATGHTWGDWAITTEPTCTEEGEEERECSVCHTTETRPVQALGHDWSTVWSTDGTYHWHVCKRPGCSAVNDKAEHTILYTYSYEDEILDVERKCSVCEFIKIDEIEDEDGVFRMDIFADPGLSVTTTEESGINIIQVSIVNTSGISNIHWYNNADGQIVDYLEGLTSFKVKGTGHYAFYCKYKDELKITRTLLVQFKKRV